MSRIVIDAAALAHNLETVEAWVAEHGARLTVVTKALCGHGPTLQLLADLGVRSIGDSRTQNLRSACDCVPPGQAWYLRPPHREALHDVVTYSGVSLNSELETVRALDATCGERGLRHGVVVMVELGDLREGVLPGGLVAFARTVQELPHLELKGIGANLGCFSGTVPTPEQFAQLALYHELLELKFGARLPFVSAGTSVVLPLLLEGRLPRAINHFRVGEAIFLGTDLVHGGVLPGLRDDAVTLEAEIVELKEKGLQPTGETNDAAPFGSHDVVGAAPGQRGFRALVNFGQLDTEVGSLRPVEPGHEIVGASSDITAVHLGPSAGALAVGDTIRFHVGYSAFVRAMASPYASKSILPMPGLLRSRSTRRSALREFLPRRASLASSAQRLSASRSVDSNQRTSSPHEGSGDRSDRSRRELA